MNRLVSLIALILVTVCVSNTSLTLSQEHNHSLPTGLTFYTGSSDFTDALYYVDPDTLEMRPLITFSPNDRPKTLSWSPDGQFFALVNDLVGSEEEPDELCIYSADGEAISCQELRLWNPSGYRFPISWNADGEKISVLLRTSDNLPQLGQISLETNTLQAGPVLSLDDEELMMIRWSPTGEQIAYQTRFEMEGRNERLYLFEVATGNQLFLTTRSYENCVAWTNDGMYLGVVRSLWREEEFPFLGQTDGLTVYDTNGQIVNHVYSIFEGRSVFKCAFAWSHDNTKIAFFSGYVTDNEEINGGVFVSEVDNNKTTLVAIDNGVNGGLSIAWSPDDTHLVIENLYHNFRDIRVYSLDGWTQVFSVEGFPLFDPAWRSIP